MKLADRQLSEINFSPRASKVIAFAEVKTVAQLANASFGSLLKFPAGIVTFKELIAACLDNFFQPKWLPEMSHSWAYRHTEPDESKMVRLSGPYSASEKWMLEKAVLQLGKIEHVVSRENDGLWLWRDKNGFIETSPE